MLLCRSTALRADQICKTSVGMWLVYTVITASAAYYVAGMVRRLCTRKSEKQLAAEYDDL